MKKADDVEVQWAKWLENNPPESFEDVNEEELRERTIRELTYVSQMDVKEYTLYQKWCEIKEKYPTVKVVDLWEGDKEVLADEGQRRAIQEIKANFWNPVDVEE